jgi:radical SAM superfamily enzyme YgiQ (UPF0313 family)
MKISLINPPSQFFAPMSLKDKVSLFLNFLKDGAVNAETAWPPLGVLYLGATLKEAGYEVSVLDAAVKGWYYDKIEEWIKKENPDVLGISALTPNFTQGMEIARRVKMEMPETKIVLGGYHATFMAEETLREFPFVDVVVRNEGEETLLDVLAAFKNKKKMNKIDGISYVHENKIVHNPKRKFAKHIDKIPIPDRSLVEDEYANTLAGMSFTTGKFTTIITSRGCPFRCTFCACTAFRGNMTSFRSPENVVDEIEQLIGQGYEDIGIVDDSFTLIRKRTEKLCELIKRRHLKFHWWCGSRVDSASYELFSKMKEAGCEAVFFGFENANQRILDYYNKRITPQQSIKAVRAAKKAKLNATGTFIVGAPIETKAEVINTLEFAKNLGLDGVGIGPLWAYPGTQIWDEIITKNPELHKYWKTGFMPVEVGMCEYSLEWLTNAIGKTIKEFYLNPLYIVRESIKALKDPYLRKMVFRKIAG